MTVQTVTDDQFARLVAPYQAELLAHCRRLLRDAGDAEDQVQETMLRAWRSYDGFQGRSSLRTWLYRIATNVCLTALERRGRLPVPVGLPAETEHPASPLDSPTGLTEDPAELISRRETSRRAILVAWKRLSAQQRAVLVLSDVMTWSAAEIADLLDMSPAAVYSMLRRARRRLTEGAPEDFAAEPLPGHEARLLDAYALAFEAGDSFALVDLLAADAVYEKHPGSTRLTGRDDILRFIPACPAFGQARLLPITFDNLPGFGVYHADPDGGYRAQGIDVLTTNAAGFKHIEVIEDRTLFSSLGLPLTLDR